MNFKRKFDQIDPFDQILFNKIKFLEGKINSACTKCCKKISKTDIVCINSQNSYLIKQKYHLSCYFPLFKSYLKKDHVEYGYLSQGNLITVRKWIKDWNLIRLADTTLENNGKLKNKQLIKSEEMSVNSPFQAIKTVQISYQYWIIIISFLPVQEIMINSKRISRYFYNIANSATLWHNLCLRDYKRTSIDQFQLEFTQKISQEKITHKIKNSDNIKDMVDIDVSLKEAVLESHGKSQLNFYELYFALYFKCCYDCKKYQNNELDICPFEKRPLCESCRLKDDYVLIKLSEIKKKYGVIIWNIFENSFKKFCFDVQGEKNFYKKYVQQVQNIYQQIIL